MVLLVATHEPKFHYEVFKVGATQSIATCKDHQITSLLNQHACIAQPSLEDSASVSSIPNVKHGAGPRRLTGDFPQLEAQCPPTR